jgi:voltage-dependent calcium channel L type alpha-1D
LTTGEPNPQLNLCGGHNTCGSNEVCGKTEINPSFGFMSFDNIFYAFLSVYTSVTMEGWSTIMANTQMTFNDFSFLYFLPLIFVGGFFLMNLTLAVIKAKFS